MASDIQLKLTDHEAFLVKILLQDATRDSRDVNAKDYPSIISKIDTAVDKAMGGISVFFDGNKPSGNWFGSYIVSPLMDAAAHRLVQVNTNNQAEYQGLILALDACLDFVINGDIKAGSTITIFGDSQLVINQMRGTYRVHNVELRTLHETAADRCEQLADAKVKLTFKYIPREENNKALGLPD